MMSRVPRVSGPRLQWVKELGLDEILARRLLPGTIEDGLKGVKGMSKTNETGTSQLDDALDAFFVDVKRIVGAKVKELMAENQSKDAIEANSKFSGYEGSFGSIEEFYHGASETLKLAYPNPNFSKGIKEEHTLHPSSKRFFCDIELPDRYMPARGVLVGSESKLEGPSF